MDLSKFNRTWYRLAMWIIVPPALAVAIHVGVNAYDRHMNEHAERLRGLRDSVPAMEAALKRANDVLADIPAGPMKEADVAARIGEHVGIAAPRRDLTLISFARSDQPAPEGLAGSTLAFAVTLEGSVRAGALFLNELQGAEPMLHVERLQVGTQRITGRDPPCRIEMLLRYHHVP